jgi:hypothetical protein
MPVLSSLSGHEVNEIAQATCQQKTPPAAPSSDAAATAFTSTPGVCATSRYDNIKKAADQIEASAATHGLIILNVKNLLDYDALWPSPSVSYPEQLAIDLLQAQVAGIIKGLEEIPNEDWRDALALARKAALPIVFIGQAGFSAIPKFGNQPHFMSIKAACTYLEPHGDPKGSMKLGETAGQGKPLWSASPQHRGRPRSWSCSSWVGVIGYIAG